MRKAPGLKKDSHRKTTEHKQTQPNSRKQVLTSQYCQPNLHMKSIYQLPKHSFIIQGFSTVLPRYHHIHNMTFTLSTTSSTVTTLLLKIKPILSYQIDYTMACQMINNPLLH